MYDKILFYFVILHNFRGLKKADAVQNYKTKLGLKLPAYRDIAKVEAGLLLLLQSKPIYLFISFLRQTFHSTVYLPPFLFFMSFSVIEL